MNKIIVNCPINTLSLGNVSINLLKEIYKLNIDCSIIELGRTDLSSFDSLDQDFLDWLDTNIKEANRKIDKKDTTLKIWHLAGSHSRVSSRQILYTFYELDSPTDSEVNLANFQDKTVFSSSHASNLFKGSHYSPLGFDESFITTDKKYLSGKIHFGLMGKFEKRKHTKIIIQNWLKRFGNNKDYQLSCCVTNPFFKNEDMDAIIADTLNGEKYFNINFLPWLPQNSQFNDFINSIDIDLTGASGAEGWNLPAFNATCLGKWSIVLDSTSHKDWANKDNCILIKPNGQIPAVDNIFFTENSEFNQGNINTFDDDEFITAMEKAIEKCSIVNTNGKKLKKDFNYSNTLEKILE